MQKKTLQFYDISVTKFRLLCQEMRPKYPTTDWLTMSSIATPAFSFWMLVEVHLDLSEISIRKYKS